MNIFRDAVARGLKSPPKELDMSQKVFDELKEAPREWREATEVDQAPPPDYPVRKITRKQIERYYEQGLLPECRREDGTPGFPLYTDDRIEFIDKLEQKWNYRPRHLKEITDWEETLIDEILTADEIDYPEVGELEFFILWLRYNIKQDKYQLKYTRTGRKERQEFKAKIKKNKKLVKHLKDKKFENLPDKTAESIKKAVLGIQIHLETGRVLMVAQDRAKAMMGFSPNIIFSYWGWYKTGETPPSDFKYHYEDSLRTWCVKDWKSSVFYETEKGKRVRVPKWGFFATPEFFIEKTDTGVDIKIRDTEEVTSNYMRSTIEPIYTRIRGSLKPPRKGWGEKSGIKKRLKMRNEMMQKSYDELKEAKPNISADKRFEKVLQCIRPDFGELSLERARRIIYGGKQMGQK